MSNANPSFDPGLFTDETQMAGKVVRRSFFAGLWIVLKTIAMFPLAAPIFDTKRLVKPLPMPPPFDIGREPLNPFFTRFAAWVSYLGFLAFFIVSALVMPILILPSFALLVHIQARRISAVRAGEVPSVRELWGDLSRATTSDKLGYGIEPSGRKLIPGGLLTVAVLMALPTFTGALLPDAAWLTSTLGALSIIVGLFLSFKASTDRASYLRQDREITIKHGHDLATWLGIPVQVFDKRTKIFYWGSAHDGIFIERNTAVQAVDADFIEQKLAVTWPELMVEHNDQRGLLLLPTTPEHMEKRRIFRESGGLISGTTLAAPPVPDFAPAVAAPHTTPWDEHDWLAKAPEDTTPAIDALPDSLDFS